MRDEVQNAVIEALRDRLIANGSLNFLQAPDLSDTTPLDLAWEVVSAFTTVGRSIEGSGMNHRTARHIAQSVCATFALASHFPEVNAHYAALGAAVHDVGRLVCHDVEHLTRGQQILQSLGVKDPLLLKTPTGHYFWGFGWENPYPDQETLAAWLWNTQSYADHRGLTNLLIALGESSNRQAQIPSFEGVTPVISPVDFQERLGIESDPRYYARSEELATNVVGLLLMISVVEYLKRERGFDYDALIGQAHNELWPEVAQRFQLAIW